MNSPDRDTKLLTGDDPADILRRAEAHLEHGRSKAAIAVLKQLRSCTIDEKTIGAADRFFRPWIAGNRRVVASFDPDRRPGSDEIVVIYGNYPHIFENVVVNNPVKRHVSSFWDLEHDTVEYHPAWEAAEQIYVINIDKRTDRLHAVLRELAVAKAPFQRITRISAEVADEGTTNRQLAAQIACLGSHLKALAHAERGGYDNIVVLEDDFSFTSDRETHWQDLAAFFERRYAYWLCLLATSKYGPIAQKDDLVALSFQRCTNTSGYLVSREGIGKLIEVQTEALENLKSTGEFRFAVDRHWTKLQPSGKFLVFRRKLGFQAASFSDIEGEVAQYFD